MASLAARILTCFHMAGPLRANTTSSIKPEVYNVSQRHPKRTEPHKIWSKLDVQFRIYARADRKARNHKDTQTCSSQYSLQQVCVDPRSSDHSTTLRAALSIWWALRTSPCRGPNPSVDRRVRWIPNHMFKCIVVNTAQINSEI